MLKKLLKFFGCCTHEHPEKVGYGKVRCKDCGNFI